MFIYMGHRDSVDPSKIAIEGSSTFSVAESATDSPESVDEIPVDEVPSNSPSTNEGVKRKAAEKPGKSGRKGKKRWDDPDSNAEWQTSFMEMWERSMEQDNARFESSAEMYREAQRMQMEQTNAILAGFKDIFKDLVSK